MSYLSNRNNANGERVVLDRLSKVTGYKANITPVSHKFDFTLEDESNWKAVGEIKTRQFFYKEGWFVSDDKRLLLEKVADTIGVSPWFVIHCMANDVIYKLDLSTPYKWQPKRMTNRFSETNPSQWGRIVELESWVALPSTSVDGGKLTTN
jgi:hypothetical protein